MWNLWKRFWQWRDRVWFGNLAKKRGFNSWEEYAYAKWKIPLQKDGEVKKE